MQNTTRQFQAIDVVARDAQVRYMRKCFARVSYCFQLLIRLFLDESRYQYNLFYKKLILQKKQETVLQARTLLSFCIL